MLGHTNGKQLSLHGNQLLPAKNTLTDKQKSASFVVEVEVWLSLCLSCVSMCAHTHVTSYLQHQNDRLHHVPLRPPAVHDDGEAARFTLLTVNTHTD